MGFFERLKQERDKEDAEYRNRLANLHVQSGIEDNQKKRAERDLRVRLQKSRSFFHQAGIEELVKRLSTIDAFVQFGYPSKGNWKDGRIQDCEYQDGTYRRWVITHHDHFNYGGTTTMTRFTETFFGIVVNHEGTIEFKGSPLFGTRKVSQLQWKNDKEVLEDAMGKAYRHPQKNAWSDVFSAETPLHR